MNRTNVTYRPLGEFIRKVDCRNNALKISKLVGLTIEKSFIPSVANVIGTDLSNYKIIRKGQFACSLMQVSRDGKMPIAMFTDDEAIMSPAYPMFEVVDTNRLLPEFLMMWFSRSEFDRESSYYAVGGVRGSLEWDDFCAMKIPVPPVEEQHRIVEQYNAVQRRIDIQTKLITKLQDTAQTLYKKTFVDGIDKDHLPDGWRMGTIGEICEISAGGDKPYYFSETKNDAYNIPVFANGIENEGLYGYTNKAKISVPSVTISARGTIGFVCLRTEPYVPIVRLLVCIPKKLISNSVLYLYFMLMNTKLEGDGAVQLQLTAPKFKEIEIIIPNINLIEEFDRNVFSILRLINTIKKENEKLTEMLSLLMVEMGN